MKPKMRSRPCCKKESYGAICYINTEHFMFARITRSRLMLCEKYSCLGFLCYMKNLSDMLSASTLLLLYCTDTQNTSNENEETFQIGFGSHTWVVVCTYRLFP